MPKSNNHYFTTSGWDGEVLTTFDVRFYFHVTEEEATDILYKAVAKYMEEPYGDVEDDAYESMFRWINTLDVGFEGIRKVLIPEFIRLPLLSIEDQE